MKILITNNRFGLRGGSETFLRDWTLGMEREGHSVVCFSSGHGPLDRPVADLSVRTIDELDRLPFRPDVIHGQHHLDMMAALTALVDVPAICHCHGAVWQECPPIHPRIYRYLAVSHTLAERMAVESSIPPADIEVLLNRIDMERFSTVRVPAAAPSRAVFFNQRHAADSETLAAVRLAAGRRGLTLDVVGTAPERRIARPEATLPTYDMVFASGRSAIEAMACGCAVVVLGRTSCGEMVAPENYERLRRVNFSIAVNSPPPTPASIEHELGRYSADECAWVTGRIRSDADVTVSIAALVDLYAVVIAQHRRARPNLAQEMAATAAYLQSLAPMVAMTDARRDGRWEGASAPEIRARLSAVEPDRSQEA